MCENYTLSLSSICLKKEKIVTNIFERAMLNILLLCISLLQLDANLIRSKNKRRPKVARQNPPKRTVSVLVPVQCRRHTDFFHKILWAVALVTKSFLVLLMVESWRRVRESENLEWKRVYKRAPRNLLKLVGGSGRWG